MKNQITFLTLLMLICFSSLQAQVSQEWVARYNGPANEDDYPAKLAVDGLGNVYITGYSFGSGTSTDCETIKYNSSGVLMWASIYHGPGDSVDYTNSLALDNSGNVYVTGSSFGIGTGMDCITIKYNSSGVQQWVATYNGPGNTEDLGNSIGIDASGNVYVTGGSIISGIGEDLIIIKYNSSGIQQWIQIYGPDIANEGFSLTIGNSGNIYIAGGSYTKETGVDYLTMKYDSSGVLQWDEKYNGPGNDYDLVHDITLDNFENVYVTGEISPINSSFIRDYGTIKYNSSGSQQWVQRYNSTGEKTDRGNSVAVDNSGNVYVTGSAGTIKYNSGGALQWAQTMAADFVEVDGSGSIYAAGTDYFTAPPEYITIKYNSSGIQQWIQSYNGTGIGSNYLTSLAIGSSGNVYVTGYSEGDTTFFDFATIKYSHTTGISQVFNSNPDKFSLSQNYPNPFNPKTIINYQLSISNNVSLKIYDILGNEVAALVNKKQNAGKYSVEWDASNFPSGTYFYKLQAGEFVEAKEMTLIK